MSRSLKDGRVQEPIFGPPATTLREAFIRFGNAMHWEAYFFVEDLWEEMGRVNDGSPDALVNAALERLPRAEHGLLTEFITELASGKFSFAEARAIWEESENDTIYITWKEPDELLRFLRYVRDRIEPHACPASPLRFRPD